MIESRLRRLGGWGRGVFSSNGDKNQRQELNGRKKERSQPKRSVDVDVGMGLVYPLRGYLSAKAGQRERERERSS